jgi:hypothetical protein
MYELYQVGAKSYYIDCPAKIGVYQAIPKCCLFNIIKEVPYFNIAKV